MENKFRKKYRLRKFKLTDDDKNFMETTDEDLNKIVKEEVENKINDLCDKIKEMNTKITSKTPKKKHSLLKKENSS